MSRKTRVVGFSLPPEIDNKLLKIMKNKHKTRSEFMREMIDLYFSSVRSDVRKNMDEKIDLDKTSLAKILMSYWLLRSQTSVKVITIGLAIIVNKEGEVLIGARKMKDQWVENLTWVFPGGEVESLDFSDDLKKRVKEETGLNIEIDSLIASRVHPDSGNRNIQINALYYYCSLTEKTKLKPGGSLKSLKWVKPVDVFKYFTTSTCDEVSKFLFTLQESSI